MKIRIGPREIKSNDQLLFRENRRRDGEHTETRDGGAAAGPDVPGKWGEKKAIISYTLTRAQKKSRTSGNVMGSNYILLAVRNNTRVHGHDGTVV